jgi:hypothetical protein
MLCPTTRVHRACLSILPKHKSTIRSRNKPQEHVRQEDPNRILHARDALITLRLLGNIHASENGKGNEIAQPNKRVHVEEEPSLDEREHEEKGREGAKRPAYNAPNPFGVDVFVAAPRAVEVNGVQADDGDAEDELEEAEEDAQSGGDGEVGPKGCAGGGFLGLQAPARKERESHLSNHDCESGVFGISLEMRKLTL